MSLQPNLRPGMQRGCFTVGSGFTATCIVQMTEFQVAPAVNTLWCEVYMRRISPSSCAAAAGSPSLCSCNTHTCKPCHMAPLPAKHRAWGAVMLHVVSLRLCKHPLETAGGSL